MAIIRPPTGYDIDATAGIRWRRAMGPHIDLPADAWPDDLAAPLRDLIHGTMVWVRGDDGRWLAGRVVVRPAHRPRRDPSAARVVRSYRLHPDTAARIVAESRRTGESQGQVIDRIVAAL